MGILVVTKSWMAHSVFKWDCCVCFCCYMHKASMNYTIYNHKCISGLDSSYMG